MMMPLPELKNDEMDRSQTRDKLPSKLRILDTDRLNLKHEARVEKRECGQSCYQAAQG